MANEKILQTVFTGEVFQPVRLYYDVFNKQAVVKVFAKTALYGIRSSPRPMGLVVSKRGQKAKF